MKSLTDNGLRVYSLSREEAVKLIQSLVGQLAGTSDGCFDAIARDPKDPRNDTRVAFVVSESP